MTESVEPPVVSVVAGNPTPEELAALVTVLAAASSAGGGTAQPEVVHPWADHRQAVRPGGWTHGRQMWRLARRF